MYNNYYNVSNQSTFRTDLHHKNTFAQGELHVMICIKSKFMLTRLTNYGGLTDMFIGSETNPYT